MEAAMLNKLFCFKLRLLACCAAVLLGACSEIPDPYSASPLDADEMLTVEAIFKDKDYKPEEPEQVRWLEDGSGYTVLETLVEYKDRKPEKDDEGEDIRWPEEVAFYDAKTLARSVLISAQSLTPGGTERALVVDDYHWSEDSSKLLVYSNSKKVWRSKSRGDYWVLDIASGGLWQLGGEEVEPSSLMFAKFSPDAGKVAFVRADNIYVQELDSREISQLTNDASATLINGLFDWAYEEEFGIKDGFRWSPDGLRIAYWQLDTSAAQDFLMINNTDQLYPTITRFPYPKVGEENSAARVGMVALATRQTVWAKLPGVAKDMYIPRMDWADRSDAIIVQQLNRKQDTNTVYYADADSGELTLVLREEEQAFIEDVEDVTWLEGQNAFTWISERSGWRHAYRVSGDGKTITDLTPGDFDIVKISAVDDAGGWLYFIASPENVGQRYLFRSKLDGSGQMERITPDTYAGTNSYQVSKDTRWAIHTHSSFSQPPRYRLVSLPTHKTEHILETNQLLIDKLAGLALGDSEFFQVKVSDGLLLDGYIMRPPEFDAGHKYPIVNFVYGEPAGQTVTDEWGGDRHLFHLLLTQRGFIVASVDNRGTSAPRGRQWRQSIYGAVGVLSSRDQADALQAMLARWSYIDADRVGIWGHSGGGSMTLNMMFRYPDLYHVGISRAPVPDQKLYDSIYQERYSGLLEDHEEGYRLGSPITYAEQLQGKLLLIHGTGDDNVHYQGSERLIDELVKHNRQFNFMSYPNRTHSIKEREGTEVHMHTMMLDYFTEHLQRRQGV
jgi:dipeptidyl-peptidase-4